MSGQPADCDASSANLGDIIRKRRLELSLTQEQLSERISADNEYVRQSDISNLERGRVQLPRRQRLQRIAAALDLPLGQLLALSGWVEADRHLAASLAGAPFSAAVAEPSGTLAVNRVGRWWQGEADAVRIVAARFAHNHFDSLIDGYRNAAMWMVSAGQGLSGFLLLVNRHDREVVSLGFWHSEAAMTQSMASVVLPDHIMRLGDQLADPPSIEHYRLVERVVHERERHESRLAQIDRVTTALDGEPDVIRQFHHHAEHSYDRPVRLHRAVLLHDPASRRPVAVGIWHLMDAEARRDHMLSRANGAKFPQLLQPADSRDFEVEVEV